MPASSLSEALSWGVYLASGLALLLLLYPLVQGVAGGTEGAAAKSDIAGVSRVMNNLEPGVTVRYFYEGVSSTTLLLGGHSVTLQTPQGVLTAGCRWVLPNTTLAAGSSYLVFLRGPAVVVESVG